MANQEISGSMQILESTVESFQKKIKGIDDIQRVLLGLESINASQVFEAVLSAALNLGASDVHIEPQEENTALRMRVDGVLRDAAVINGHLYKLILSRIKLLSGLKLNIHDSPQEGRFSVRLAGRDIEMRTSVLPSEYGEDIALRVLDPRFLLSLEELGMRRALQVRMDEELKNPQGLVLVTGPTGSGKTTTLYAFVQKLARGDIKIVTIEDPIEYHIEGVAQTQVDPDKGYTFEAGLRAILRQDPDVILVGELRERVSAEAALGAALAGKKVLATLHTQDAAGAVPRMGALGVNETAIASGLSAVISQRLVRSLCKECGKERILTEKEVKRFREILGNTEVSQISTRTKIYTAGVGCKACLGGYLGRIGIFEDIFFDKDLREVVKQRPTDDEIRDAAQKKGMSTMRQDAVLKILDGITTLEEAERVLGKL